MRLLMAQQPNRTRFLGLGRRFRTLLSVARFPDLLRPALPCVCWLVLGTILFLRGPASLLQAEFWAEDGPLWYTDAYAVGWPSLFSPHTGYLQLLPRLIASAACAAPLAWAPTIFAAVAFVIQTLPAGFLVSRRMEVAWPGFLGRFLVAFLYVALPNSDETYVNLTNSQWHLAVLAFLILVSEPKRGRLSKMSDLLVLIISGLTGPFCLVLVPIAIWDLWDHRDAPRVARAIVIAGAAAVQGVFLLASIGSARSGAPLGAGVGVLAQLLSVHLFLGGPLGKAVSLQLIDLWHNRVVSVGVTVVGFLLVSVALLRGPPVLRKAALVGGLILVAALVSPQASMVEPQWPAMAGPATAQRYFLIPLLVWVGASLSLAGDRNQILRSAGMGLLLLFAVGVVGDWDHPSRPPTDFAEKARVFDLAPPGTRMTFAIQPPGWFMVLTR